MPPAFRPADRRDAATVQAIYAPFCESTAVSFETVAPTVEEVAGRIESITARFPWLVCELDGVIAGYAYACAHRERAAYQLAADVTIYTGERFRGVGLGRGLYTSLFRLLVSQGYYKACAGVTLPNPASVGLHTAMGFAPVGVYRGVGYKAGCWHDVLWLQKELQPETDAPAPPVRFAELNKADVADAIQEGLRRVRVG